MYVKGAEITFFLNTENTGIPVGSSNPQASHESSKRSERAVLRENKRIVNAAIEEYDKENEKASAAVEVPAFVEVPTVVEMPAFVEVPAVVEEDPKILEMKNQM